MITSLSWLKNHLSTKANLNQVAERLTEIGLEVENIKSSIQFDFIDALRLLLILSSVSGKSATNKLVVMSFAIRSMLNAPDELFNICNSTFVLLSSKSNSVLSSWFAKL